MSKKNIIVIGASAGGFEAIRQLTAELPHDLDAAIFIVWHMSPTVRGVLPQVINRQKNLLAVNAVDNEPIAFNRIYIAPPDHHMMIEEGFIRITRGPKENRFRPAVDPLFRSAAYIYGSRVIGIVLSGALDDGTAGLWTIKNRGGTAIVQEPADAQVSSMPESALEYVDADYKIPMSEMAAVLARLVNEDAEQTEQTDIEENKKVDIEVRIALQDEALERGVLDLGAFTPYTCPDCHGALSAIRDGRIVRYRCHTGHAYSVDSLLNTVTEKVEDSLWNAIRGFEESIILLNRLGDQYAAINKPKIASVYFRKANEAHERAKLVRQAVLNHESLTIDEINEEAGGSEKEKEKESGEGEENLLH